MIFPSCKQTTGMPPLSSVSKAYFTIKDATWLFFKIGQVPDNMSVLVNGVWSEKHNNYFLSGYK